MNGPLPEAPPVPAGEAEPPPGGIRPRWLDRRTALTVLTLAAVFTALCLQWSLTHGRLSQDSTYDDCAYLYDGGSRLNLLYERGFGAFFADAVCNPPHAPFTAYGATLAFALFGVHDWSPYVLNGMIVCALLGFVSYVARGLSLRWRAALMVLPLTLPIGISVVHDYRPDSLCALLSVIGMYLVAEAGAYRVGREQRRPLIAGGMAFGLALWAKPPVFGLTLLTAGLAAGGAWLAANLFDPQRNPRRAADSALRMGVPVALACVLVAAPYYAVNGVHVFRYFFYNTFNKNTDFWKMPGGWAGSAHYYVFGQAGDLLMGRGFYAWAVLYVLALGWVAWRRQFRELVLQAVLLLLAAASLAAVVYGRIENPFFGMTWVMVMVAACLRAWAFVFSTLDLARGQGLLAGILVVSLGVSDLTLLRLRHSWPQHNPAVDALTGTGHSINQRILDDISAEVARRGGHPDEPPMTFLTVTGFINEATLRWMAFREGRALAFSDLQTESRFEPFVGKIAAASFIVSGEDRTGGVFEIMPPWKLRFQLADYVAAEARAGQLRLLGRYPTPEGGSYRLWVNEEEAARNAGIFSPISGEEGFMPMEGPYPQWHEGRVRWALGPRSQFTFDAASAGEGKLDMWVHALAEPVHAAVLLDGKPLGEMDVPPGEAFRHVVLPAALHAGANRFAFVCARDPSPSPDGYHRAILFSQLEVQTAP